MIYYIFRYKTSKFIANYDMYIITSDEHLQQKTKHYYLLEEQCKKVKCERDDEHKQRASLHNSNVAIIQNGNLVQIYK